MVLLDRFILFYEKNKIIRNGNKNQQYHYTGVMRTYEFLIFQMQKLARPAGQILKLRFKISGDSHRLPSCA